MAAKMPMMKKTAKKKMPPLPKMAPPFGRNAKGAKMCPSCRKAMGACKCGKGK